MDSSKTRRGQPCWYLKPDVGMIAINDAFMLESSIFILLKKYFRSHKAYIDFVELFQEVAFQTELGQTCDLLTAPEDHVDLDNFSLEKYSFIVIYKTAYYSFYLPVALAMLYTGKASPANLKQAEDILIEEMPVIPMWFQSYGVVHSERINHDSVLVDPRTFLRVEQLEVTEE